MSSCQMCRLCGSTKQTIYLFDKKVTKSERRLRVLYILLATGIHIKKDDVIPKMVCQNCCEIVEKAYVYRTNAEKNQSKVRCLDENVPTITPHKSVSNLYKEYPLITIPKQVTRADIAPVISLDKSEVSDWFAGKIKRAQNNRAANVVTKHIPNNYTKNFYKVKDNTNIENKPSNSQDSCVVAVPNTKSLGVGVASQKSGYLLKAAHKSKRKRCTSDVEEIIPSKKKRIYFNKNAICAPKKIEVPRMLPTDIGEQKSLLVSSLGLLPSTNTKHDGNIISVDNPSTTSKNPQTGCIQLVTATLSPMLPSQIQGDTNDQEISSGSNLVKSPLWTVDKLAEACRTINDLKETGEVMSLLSRGTGATNATTNSQTLAPRAPVSQSQQLRSGNYQPVLDHASKRTENRVVLSAESFAATVSNPSSTLQHIAAPANPSVYQHGNKRPSGARAVATMDVGRKHASPQVRVKQTSLAPQSTHNPILLGNTPQLGARQDVKNRNSLAHHESSKHKIQGMASQTAQSITIESLLKFQPRFGYNTPATPTAPVGARFSVGGAHTNRSQHTAAPVKIAAGNSRNVPRPVPLPGSKCASCVAGKLCTTATAPATSTVLNLPHSHTSVAPSTFKPQHNYALLVPLPNAHQTQNVPTSSLNPIYIPNGRAYDSAMNQILPGEGILPQANYYLPMMDDEYIETSFLSQSRADKLDRFPSMPACSIRSPHNMFHGTNNASGADVDRVRSPRTSPSTYEQALKSYCNAEEYPKVSSHEKRRCIRIKNIADLK